MNKKSWKETWNHRITIIRDKRRAEYAIAQLRMRCRKHPETITFLDTCHATLVNAEKLEEQQCYTLERLYRQHLMGHKTAFI